MSISLVLGGATTLIAAGLSARWNWWRPYKEGIPILMYHKIGSPPDASKMPNLWISTDMFRKQLDYIKRRGYTPILFKDIYAHWDGKAPLPEKPILITFDDGYENNYTDGFPILKEFGFPATLFVVVQTVGWDNAWHNPASEVRIKMVSWDQLKELRSAGWEIGSHTMNHPRLHTLTLKEAEMEMDKSRRVIGEFLGEVPDTLAYPYGAGADDPHIRDIAKKCGYRIAVSVHSGKWNLEEFKNGAYTLPRVYVRRDENMYDFHLQLTRGRSRF
jgi:peptidoglycan/xylan/chitin deacetylase (PgdA/CDA1 family)